MGVGRLWPAGASLSVAGGGDGVTTGGGRDLHACEENQAATNKPSFGIDLFSRSEILEMVRGTKCAPNVF